MQAAVYLTEVESAGVIRVPADFYRRCIVEKVCKYENFRRNIITLIQASTVEQCDIREPGVLNPPLPRMTSSCIFNNFHREQASWCESQPD